MKTGPLIELRHVDVTLNGTTVLQDVTWSLQSGQHWIIRGANGSGKSTFLRLLRAEVWPAPNRGDRIYRLDAGAQTTAVEVQRHIALVSPELQERYLQQDWRLDAGTVIETGFAQTDMLYVKLTQKQKKRAGLLAQQFGIASLLDRDVQTLSTGELRKILVARAVVGAPKLLLLDEVCDGLDAKFRRELLAMFEAIARHGTQIIYTTHRADEALSMITHEMQFVDGRIVRQGASPRADSVARTKGRKASARYSPHVEGAPLIKIENANVFLDGTQVLHRIHWQLRRGEHWVVLGSNGAGKTTFLKLIASDLYPAFGARLSRFEFTAENTIWDLRRRLGCVSPLLQAHYRERLTAEQVVVSGFFSSVGLMEKPSTAQRIKARDLLKEFGLAHLASKNMLALSFGELRKILTLRALVHDPELLILDEPFDGLDTESKADLAAALEQVAGRGTQLLIVTHHLDDLPHCMSHGLFLDGGRIVAAGEWRVIRKHPVVLNLFGG
ncbi:MAG TPA: ATP-binding cassette domain-containing protein [Methylomirabilota bacterium]|nr:ATP-binding cassette domain-containing protein [Methylomirabilota bacterium]